MVPSQLLTLQTYMFPALEAYYHHRSQAAKQELRRFGHHCCASHAQVQDLRTKFHVVVGAMHKFLESYADAQTEITSAHTLPKKVGAMGSRDPLPPVNVRGSSPKEVLMATGTRPHQKSRDKVVTFSQSVTCTWESMQETFSHMHKHTHAGFTSCCTIFAKIQIFMFVNVCFKRIYLHCRILFDEEYFYSKILNLWIAHLPIESDILYIVVYCCINDCMHSFWESGPENDSTHPYESVVL